MMTPPVQAPELDETTAVTAPEVVELALLPMVRVAWEDGGVDDLEKAEIISASKRLLGTAPKRLIEDWLEHRPAWSVQDAALRDLARAHNAGHPRVTDAFLGQMVTECENIAKASGSALGEAYRIDPREQAVIDDIVEGLTSQLTPTGQTSWGALLAELRV